MSTYILIHGSWHGGWCWEKVKRQLEAQGHTVSAPDLPGHGLDKTPIPQITLQSYADRIGEALRDAGEPAILVGHSMGGVAITQAAEYWPEKIAALVYLCAILPRNGQSLLDLGLQDQGSFLVPNLIVREEKGDTLVKEEAIREAFYADCSDEDVAHAQSLLVPDPLAPVATPVQITEARFGRIPRIYIECLQDRAISLALQRQMVSNTPCQQVLTLDTSHSPFFSAPEALVVHLTSVAQLQPA